MMGSELAETPWKTLHPASVLVNLIPRAWRLIRSLWPLFLAMLYGNQTSGTSLVDAGMFGMLAILSASSTILHWMTLRYRFHDGRLEIRTGLLNRQVRVIAPERVQNTERVRNVFHRLSGLVEVRIETASGTEVEGQLSALTEAEAQRLVDALEQGRGATAPADETPSPPVVENSTQDLIRFGLTASRLGATAVLIGVALEGMSWVDPEQIPETWAQLGWLGVAAVILSVLTGTWLLGTVGVVIRHHGFRLTTRERGLVAEEGLLTRRKVELPLRKVQVVTLAEPWMRRLIGIGSVHIETAAAREDGGGTQHAEAVVPVVERDRVQRVIAAALPSLDVDLDKVYLHPPHPRALVRALGRTTLQSGLMGSILAWWWWPWGLLALSLVPLGALFAWLDHKHQGWTLTDRVVVARTGWLSRRTRIVGREKLQSLEVMQGPILRRYGLGELVIRVAGNAVRLPVLDFHQALAVQQALLQLPAAPPPAVEPSQDTAPDELPQTASHSPEPPQDAAPGAPSQDTAPHEPPQDAAPDEPPQDAAPGAPSQDTAPHEPTQAAAPDEPPQDAAPSPAVDPPEDTAPGAPDELPQAAAPHGPDELPQTPSPSPEPPQDAAPTPAVDPPQDTAPDEPPQTAAPSPQPPQAAAPDDPSEPSGPS